MATPRTLLCEFALAAGALLAPSALRAQAPPPAATPFPPPAKVVTLNVIARDQRDEPVGDLNVDDLQVTDQGRTQRITFFRRAEDSRQLAAPLGPREYSNRSGTAPPHGVAILFDLLNSNFGYRAYGTDEIIRAVQHLESGDQVYLYLLTINGMLFPVHPVPDNAPAPASSSWTQQIKPMLEDAIREVTRLRPIDERLPNVRVETTYHALETLARAMAPLPGRKDVLWITHGVPLVIPQPGRQAFDYTSILQRLATSLDRAGVAIDTVDQGDALATGSKETLDLFPALTGGKAYPERTVDKAVPEVLAAPRASYVVEYAAPPPDGKFHKIRVTVARKGVRVQAEQGYFAAREADAGATNRDPAQSSPRIPGYADTVFSSPYEASGIGLWAGVSISPGAPQTAHVEIRVDSRDLSLQPEGDAFAVPLSFVLVASTPGGDQASVTSSKVTLTRAQREKPSKDDISVSQDLPVGSVQKLRFIVVDKSTNAMGSLTIPLPAQ